MRKPALFVKKVMVLDYHGRRIEGEYNGHHNREYKCKFEVVLTAGYIELLIRITRHHC